MSLLHQNGIKGFIRDGLRDAHVGLPRMSLHRNWMTRRQTNGVKWSGHTRKFSFKFLLLGKNYLILFKLVLVIKPSILT